MRTRALRAPARHVSIVMVVSAVVLHTHSIPSNASRWRRAWVTWGHQERWGAPPQHVLALELDVLPQDGLVPRGADEHERGVLGSRASIEKPAPVNRMASPEAITSASTALTSPPGAPRRGPPAGQPHAGEQRDPDRIEGVRQELDGAGDHGRVRCKTDAITRGARRHRSERARTATPWTSMGDVCLDGHGGCNVARA